MDLDTRREVPEKGCLFVPEHDPVAVCEKAFVDEKLFSIGYLTWGPDRTYLVLEGGTTSGRSKNRGLRRAAGMTEISLGRRNWTHSGRSHLELF